MRGHSRGRAHRNSEREREKRESARRQERREKITSEFGISLFRFFSKKTTLAIRSSSLSSSAGKKNTNSLSSSPTMRTACALSPAVGCAPSTSGRKNASAAAPNSSHRSNASRRCRRHRSAAAVVVKAQSSTDLMRLQPFDIDPLPPRRGTMPNSYPSAVLSAQEVRRRETWGRENEKERLPHSKRHGG